MCIYFQTLFYRRDGVNFYYTVDALLVLTDICLGKIVKKNSSWSWRDLSSARNGCGFDNFSHSVDCERPRVLQICVCLLQFSMAQIDIVG